MTSRTVILAIAGLSCYLWFVIWRGARAHRSAASGASHVLYRVGLLGAGISTATITYPLGIHLVWPGLRAIFGDPRSDFVSASLILQQVVSLFAPWMVAAPAVGYLSSRRYQPSPMDGFWLSNPATILIGYLLGAAIFGSFDVTHSEYRYWGSGMWVVHVVLAAPFYAFAFGVGARIAGWSRHPMSGHGA